MRRAGFRLLQEQEFRFLAIMADKRFLVDHVRFMKTEIMRKGKPDYRYNPNEIYDNLVTKLLGNMQHKASEYFIHFASRGSSDRTNALRTALETGKVKTLAKWGLPDSLVSHVVDTPCSKEPCLQAADYCLWALQRLMERGEERYLNLLAPKVSLIIDQHDRSKGAYGTFYTRKKPLNRAAWEERERI